jgi:hypothetical protein
MSDFSLARRFALVEENLIGVWRFHERGRQKLWCATYVFDGKYYDISGKRKLTAVLDAVHKNVLVLKEKENKNGRRK